jgi:2,3-bisphosphoglycerate-dependent phosphoglycerate mutase
MQFYFIRHGQSENNALWERTGSSEGRSEDPELTDLGHRQAARLAEYLTQNRSASENGDDPQNVAGFCLTHLYTSLMVRAVSTATYVARALGLPLMARTDAHEVGGIWNSNGEDEPPVGLPGRDRAYFRAHHAGLILPATFNADGWWNRPFEEREERQPRAQRFLADLVAQHGDTDDRVAVVSHGGFYNYVLAAFLDAPRREGLWFELNNAAITRIDLVDGAIQVRYLNRNDFLRPDLLS